LVAQQLPTIVAAQPARMPEGVATMAEIRTLMDQQNQFFQSLLLQRQFAAAPAGAGAGDDSDSMSSRKRKQEDPPMAGGGAPAPGLSDGSASAAAGAAAAGSVLPIPGVPVPEGATGVITCDGDLQYTSVQGGILHGWVAGAWRPIPTPPSTPSNDGNGSGGMIP
jgi:hypothetical protein